MLSLAGGSPTTTGPPSVFMLGGIGTIECSNGDTDDDDDHFVVNSAPEVGDIQLHEEPSGLTGLWRWEEINLDDAT